MCRRRCRMDDRTATILVAMPMVPRYRAVLARGEWHIQAGASWESVYPADTDKAITAIANGGRGMAALLEALAGDIRAGKYATAKAVAGTYKERLTATMDQREETAAAASAVCAGGNGERVGSGRDFRMMLDAGETHWGCRRCC